MAVDIRRFRAMGSECEIFVVTGDPTEPGPSTPGSVGVALLDLAEAEVRDLELRWSRFLPESVISRLNASRPGEPLLVDDETFAVVALARAAWEATGGRFDPTVLDALRSAGYDRSFDDVPPDGRFPPAPPAGPSPGFAAVGLDPERCAVTLEGAHLDLGGLGKGRAADLVAVRLLDQGASGACVNLGGDVRVAGTGPGGDPWVVGVDHPAGGELARIELLEGAVTTSARTRRRWLRDGVEAHHLIDPSTGRPAAPGIDSVTVIGGEASWSEVFAKVALIAGPEEGPSLVLDAGLAALVVRSDGAIEKVGPVEQFLVPSTGGS